MVTQAVITALAVTIPAFLSMFVAIHGQNKKFDEAKIQLEAVDAKVSTSNGKTSGQYIEEVHVLNRRLLAGQELQQKLFAEHTVQDAMNFSQLQAQVDYLTKEVGK